MNLEKRSSIIAYAVYYLILIVLYAVSFIPDQRVWGLNFWAFLPKSTYLVFLGFGITAPLLFEYINRSLSDHFKSERSFWIIGLVVTAGLGLLFYFLRAQTYFLGDGYTIVSGLFSDIASIKNRSLGESLIHIWLSDLLGGRTPDNVYHSFLIGSIGSGVLYLLFISFLAKKMYSDISSRILFFLGLISGGGMLLWFGYVEYYSIFVLTVALFTGAGILVTNGMLKRWVILPLFLLSVFLHIFGIILLPALVYLLLYDTKIANKIIRLDNKVKIGLIIVLLIFGVLVFRHYYITDYFLRFAIVPLASSPFVTEGYSLFSIAHMIDFLNLIILFVPGIIIFAILIFLNPLRGFFKKDENWFLMILIAASFSAVFIFDPKLGMPRDWDLFSFASIPLTFAVFRWLISNETVSKLKLKTAGLMIALGLLVLFSRVTVLADKEAGITQFKSYSKLDMIKNKNGRIVLINYLRDYGQKERSDEELKIWREDFAYTEAVYNMVVKADQNENRLNISKAYKSLKIEPTNWNAWTNMGVIYTELGKYDSAKICLEIADGLNPYSSTIYSNMGTVYFRTRELGLAKQHWYRALDRDSTNLTALIGLSILYKEQNNMREYMRYLSKVAKHPETPDQYLYVFYSMFLSKGDTTQAMVYYNRLLARGYDSLTIHTMSKNVNPKNPNR